MDTKKLIYLVSDDEEHWNNGEEFSSREDALAYGMEEFDPGTKFWTGIQDSPDLLRVSQGQAVLLLEHIEEGMDPPEECDPIAQRSTAVQEIELAAELTTVVQAWIEKHGLEPTWFHVTKVEEHKVPSAPPAQKGGPNGQD